jgi:hypothetical protein
LKAFPKRRLFLKLMLLNKNIKIFINYYLGPLLFIWLAYSIYHQVVNAPNFNVSWQKIIAGPNGEQTWKFWVILFLVGVNWGIEARKWQVLMNIVEKVSWWKAFKATLTGLAFAMNTPNRVGEYAGRILYVQEENRIRAVSLTLVGSISQFLITMIAGCGGLFFLLNNQQSAASLTESGSYLFWIRVLFNIVVIVSVSGLLIYFNLGWLVRLIDKLPALKKLSPHIAMLESLNVGFLLRVCSLSLTRYIVFIIQYVLMIQLMQVTVSYWQAFWLISVIYLILAIVPTIALAEVGLRGKVSLELFGLFSANKLGIIAASTGIWLVNLVIPALFGSLLILSIKIFKNK